MTFLNTVKKRVPVFIHDSEIVEYLIIAMMLVNIWNLWPDIKKTFQMSRCEWKPMKLRPFISKLALNIIWLIYGLAIVSVPTLIVNGITMIITLCTLCIIIYRNSFAYRSRKI